MPFESRLAEVVETWLPESPRPRLGIAVSGGLDSILLLEAVRRSVAAGQSWSPVVLHVDHALRPTSSREARWVARVAARAGFPFRAARLRWDHRSERAPSLEHRARLARYEALARMAREEGLDAVLTGQHRDDQGETLAWKLTRGHALLGLAPMPEARRLVEGHDLLLLRPFLSFPRSAFRTQAGVWGLSWREDETNGDLRHRRNLLRHVLLPLAGGGDSASLVDRLARLGEEVRATRCRLTRMAERLVAACATSPESRAPDGTPTLGFPLASLRALPFEVAHAVLALLIQQVEGTEHAPLDPAVTRAVMEDPARRPAHREVRRGVFVVWGEGDVLQIRAPHAEEDPRQILWTPRRLPTPGVAAAPSWPWAIRAQLDGRGDATPLLLGEPDRQILPASATVGPLRLRRHEAGETLRPFGMRGRRRVVEMLREAGIPRRRRGSYPVVADEQGILWIPGVRAAERCRVEPACGRVIRLERVERGRTAGD